MNKLNFFDRSISKLMAKAFVVLAASDVLKNEKDNLVSIRDRLRVAVEATDDKTKKCLNEVFDWLNETDKVIQEVENLTAQTETPQRKKERKKLQEKVIVQAHFKIYGFHSYEPSLEYSEDSSSGNIASQFVCFNSRQKASDQLLMALQLDNCSVIGLYGRSGSGKTALVKAVVRKTMSLHLFNEVLFVKSQMDIQLDPLSKKESWTLFKKHSGFDDEEYSSSFDITWYLPRKVASECEGLPGTIKEVGSSLRILEEKIHATLLLVFFIKLYLKGDSRPSWMMEDSTLETKFHPLF
ncbi:hypothetical protein P8452_44845 [Trifolium repens]|nr:hypothetical protein P8452_44845 [Trifolium repens]